MRKAVYNHSQTDLMSSRSVAWTVFCSDRLTELLLGDSEGAMGDLVMRISVFVQRGFICQRCGVEIDGEMTGSPRCCTACDDHRDSEHDAADSAELVGKRLVAPRP